MRLHMTTSLVLLWLTLSAGEALAWNKAGHMTTAAIAYAELKKSHPEVLAAVLKLLKEHPQHDDWTGAISFLPPEDQDQAIFMKAARWPDDIRDNRKYHRDRWHYINFPYKPEGQPASLKVIEPAKESILSAFDENLAILKSKTATADEKAIALCWLFHLVGDVHQPLHTSALFTSQFPQGDRGGTRFFIRAKPEVKSTISLHTYWDDLVGSSDRFQTVRNRSVALRAQFPRDKLEELSAAEFPKWAQESFELACKVAYREGKLAGSKDEDNGVALPADYVETVQPIAQRRVTLAGYRLADLFKQCLGQN